MTAQEWPGLRQWLLATAIVLLFAAVLGLLVRLDLGWVPPALLVVLAIGLYGLLVKKGPPPSAQESEALEAMGTLFKGVAATLVSLVLVPVLLYVWFAAMLVLSSLTGQWGWSESSWWRPFGYAGSWALYVVLAALLVVADVCAGIFAWRRLRRRGGDV